MLNERVQATTKSFCDSDDVDANVKMVERLCRLILNDGTSSLGIRLIGTLDPRKNDTLSNKYKVAFIASRKSPRLHQYGSRERWFNTMAHKQIKREGQAVVCFKRDSCVVVAVVVVGYVTPAYVCVWYCRLPDIHAREDEEEEIKRQTLIQDKQWKKCGQDLRLCCRSHRLSFVRRARCGSKGLSVLALREAKDRSGS